MMIVSRRQSARHQLQGSHVLAGAASVKVGVARTIGSAFEHGNLTQLAVRSLDRPGSVRIRAASSSLFLGRRLAMSIEVKKKRWRSSKILGFVMRLFTGTSS
ncbi:MAG: hypothetical protein L6Q69_21600 [Zoogloea sp.]|nr:hypothetical protein [Zoogloea sp.]